MSEMKRSDVSLKNSVDFRNPLFVKASKPAASVIRKEDAFGSFSSSSSSSKLTPKEFHKEDAFGSFSSSKLPQKETRKEDVFGSFSSSKSLQKEIEQWTGSKHSSLEDDSLSPRKILEVQVYRTVELHVTETARSKALASRKFCDNKLVTSKYNVLNFLPINLFQQFSRSANLYFLLNAVVQLIPGLSPTGWETTIVPLSLVLLLNAIKEAFDDYKSHKFDKEVNRRIAEVLQGEGLKTLEWRSIIVGDIIRVQNNSDIPADLLFLSSSDPQGLAYLETTNLDGETNLKTRNAFYQTSTLNPDDGDMSFNALSGIVIECEQPNNKLYEFQGSVSCQGQGLMPLDVNQILLRGAILRNTEWVIGAVIFTGADTKYMKNMVSAPRKVSHLEKKTSILVSGLFILQLLLCIGLAIGHFMWSDKYGDQFYLENSTGWPEPGLNLAGLLVQLLRFVILLSSLIPISLYVSLELVKVIQCCFIRWDTQMVHLPSGVPAQARTSNLNEELGQVQYVLADKTGTLTQNVMAFVQCSINGVVYGDLTARGVLGEAENSGHNIHTVSEDPYLIDELQALDTSPTSQSKRCKDFFLHLAICHTVTPIYSEGGDTIIAYQSSSPDEEALVQGAAICGFQLTKRISNELVIECQGQHTEIKKILAVLEFTNERRRMSIICKNADGRIKLYCKGADTVILKRLAKDQGGIAEVSVKHMEEFAHGGYRTLCIAEREIDDVEYETWASRFRAASVALDDREERLSEAADSIERELVLLGVTAVEDKLQEGVPETVTLLSQAGIKLWVLTGDKLETAVSVGLACNLLADSMHLFLLCESSFNTVPQMLHTMLTEARERSSAMCSQGQDASDMALVIEGEALSVALEEHYKSYFLELCQECRTVVCCRVSPLQKALVTQLVKENNMSITLAIGDGANDVAMIRAAHIGIGITGREGTSAVLASDYAIGQFRFLARLLLIHGRWSYKRNKLLVMYSFYKNIVFVMGQCYYAFFSGLSAQSLYPRTLISTYNLLWTSLPCLALSTLDQDVHQRTVESNPQLYRETQREKLQFFFVEASCWIMAGFWHSLVAFFFPLASMKMSGLGGSTQIYDVGTATYTLAVVIVNLKIIFCSNNFTIISLICVWILSIFCYFISLPVLAYVGVIFTSLQDLSDIGFEIYDNKVFWVVLFVSLVTAFLPDWGFTMLLRHLRPNDFHIFQEIEHGWRSGVFMETDSDYVEPVSISPSYAPSLAPSQAPSQASSRRVSRVFDKLENPLRKSIDSLELPARRRMTWREVLSEAELDQLFHSHVEPDWSRRVSSGFEVVTRHSDVSTIPKPLIEGPLPPLRV